MIAIRNCLYADLTMPVYNTNIFSLFLLRQIPSLYIFRNHFASYGYRHISIIIYLSDSFEKETGISAKKYRYENTYRNYK